MSQNFEHAFEDISKSSTEIISYWPELAGLRGVAIMVVVIGHLLQRLPRFYEGNFQASGLEKDVYALLATPFSGCCIFFCVSGYTLYEYLCRKHLSSNSRLINSYILRRLVRLYPPYALVITATYVFILVTGYRPIGTNFFFSAPDSLALSFIASLTLTHDLAFGTFPRLFPPGWFVETQIQFYLAAPFIWQAYILRAPRKLLTAAVVLLAFLLISLITVRLSINLEYSILEFMPYFWVGALAAMLNGHFSEMRGIDRLSKISSLSWLAFIAFFLAGEPASSPSLQLFVRLICLILMLVFAFVQSTSFRAFLVQEWLITLGKLSFSIYLVHLQTLQLTIFFIMKGLSKYPPLLVLIVSVFGGASAVLLVSIVFYWLVERPCQRTARELFA